MQISTHEVEKLLRRTKRPLVGTEAPVSSVEELADRYDVKPADVERCEEAVRMAEPDPWRERRIRELIAKVEAGTYQVAAEDIVDMAERRAVADRAAQL
jgi:hypothetical protein